MTNTSPTLAHSAGPWTTGTNTELGAYPGKSYVLKADPDGVYYEIANCHGNEANASLIAAAPELLEACKGMLDFFIQYDVDNKVVSGISLILTSALNKAEGRS